MDKFELITRNLQEIIGEEELKELLKSKKKPVVYCGYETSGEVHLGHLVSMTKLLDLQKAGFKVKVLFADWHTYLNQKGDWDFIKKEIKRWKKIFSDFGLNKAEFILGSEVERNLDYVDDVFNLATKTTLKRGLRSMQTVARDIDNAKISQVIYPLMQIADFKYLKVDCALGGIEQRKIHMLALESLKEINYKTPILFHHELIPSLQGSEKGKMSSSDSSGLISIQDTEEEIKSKIKKAYCPEGIIEENPILKIAKLLVFPKYNKIIIKRPEKFGGTVEYASYEELEEDFVSKNLHPLDLKNAVAEEIINLLKPFKNSKKL